MSDDAKPKAAFKFRKPRSRKGKLRKAMTSSNALGWPDEADQDMDKSLALLKMGQKRRQRNKGRDVTKLALLPKERKIDLDLEAAVIAYAEKGGLMDGEDAALVKKNLEGLLDGSFAQSSTKDKKEEDPALEAFLNKRLGLKDEKAKTEDDFTKEAAREAENQVYKMPEDLRNKILASRESQVEEFSTDGGPMAFGTGIAEVELPVEFKLKNIMDTETAKFKLIHARETRAKEREGKREEKAKQNKRDFQKLNEARDAAPDGNLTANYRHHSRSFAQEMRAKRAAFGGGGGGRGGGRGGPGFSSDDRIMSRFKKRAMTRRR